MFSRPAPRGTKRVLASVMLAVLCVAYVWPDHLSAGRDVPLDVLFHVGFFAVCGVGLAWAFARCRPLWALAALGLALEIVQWRIAGFARIEWGDVASNEGGVLVAWGVAWWGQRRHAIS